MIVIMKNGMNSWKMNGDGFRYLNMPDQSLYDFKRARLTNYVQNCMELPEWRTLKPEIVSIT
jgi:hypothetical protein